MLKNMSELSDIIYQKAIEHLADQRWFLRKTNEACDRYDMPLDQSSDYLNGSRRVGDNDWFTGFVLASVIGEGLVDQFFTPMEIAEYKNQKYESRVITKIDLPMIQVATDQWIGMATFQWLMKVEDSHLLCYNENTQRVPRARIKPNGEVVYEPYVNQRSVREIAEAFKRGDYIPNTITFNIRNDVVWHYEDGHLIIQNFPKGWPIFDIIDGYHRYRAMRQIHIHNPEFDYSMELRITKFSVEKARQFIYQESLRNKMRKVDQASFDQNSLENQIIDELNELPQFRNMFSSMNPKIDRAVMAAAIRQKYFSNPGSRNRIHKAEVKRTLIDKANLLEYEAPEIFERRWANDEIVAFVIVPYSKRAGEFVHNMNQICRFIAYNNFLTRKSVIENDIRAILKEIGFREVTNTKES